MRLRYSALSLFTLVVCLTAQAGNRMLETPEQFTAGVDLIQTLFAADFTNDGKPDVLVAADSKAALVAGRGDGSFDVARPRFETWGRVEGVADFNRDGNPDLFTLADPAIGAPWTTMAGSAGGTFGTPVAGPGSMNASAVVAGDFNNDTFTDVASFTASTSTLMLYTGDGNGGFASGQSFGVVLAGVFGDLAAGDFDGDGKLDLFVVSDQESVVAWNGGGTFSVHTTLAVAGGAAAAGDVNGDGRADALALTLSGPYAPRTASVAFGTSARSFTVSQFRTEAQSYGVIAVAQLDGTGGGEVLVGMRDLSVRTHAGGAFGARRSYAMNTGTLGPGGLAAADFDGDGKTDVVAANAGKSIFSLFRGNGDGTLAADPSFEFGIDLDASYQGVVDVTDINQDGRPDAVILTRYPSQIGVAFGSVTGGFAAPVLTALPDTILFWTPYKVGDVNGDGRADLLFARYDNTKPAAFQTFLAQQNGTYTAGPMTVSSAGNTWPYLVDDFTGDGRKDLIDPDGRLFVMSATGALAAPVQTTLQLTAGSSSADMNKDGRRDVITPRTLNNSFAAAPSIYLNNGNGTFAAPIDGLAPGAGGTMADLTGDGFPDSIGRSVFRNRGNSTFEEPPFSLPWIDSGLSEVGVADFDGDGFQDVATAQALSYGNGDGTFAAAVPVPMWGVIVSTADFDGNGSPDLWVSDHVTNRLVVMRTRKRTIGTAAVTVTAEITGSDDTDRYPYVSGKVTRADGAELPGAVAILVNGSSRALAFLDAFGAYRVQAFAPIGTSTIVARYTGDRQHGAGEASITHSVQKRELPFQVGSPFGTVVGDTVTICVSMARQIPPPTGNVTIRKGSTVLGTVPVAVADGGCGSSLALAYNATLFPVGATEVTADFPADDNYLATQVTGNVFVYKPTPTLTITVTPSSLTEGQTATVTGTFTALANNVAVTGSVTFTWADQTVTVPVTNNKATFSRQVGWGDDQILAKYPGDTTYGEALGLGQLTVYRGSMTATPAIRATVVGGSVVLEISPIQGATAYDLYRAIDDQPLAYFQTRYDTHPTEGLFYGVATVYAVVARGPGGTSSPMSNRDLVLGMNFSDDPLTGAPLRIKKAHITQLQTAVNLVRRVAHVPEIVFPAPSSIISAAHLTVLRSALIEARSALGLSTTFTDPTITAHSTRVRLVHIQELRDAMK